MVTAMSASISKRRARERMRDIQAGYDWWLPSTMWSDDDRDEFVAMGKIVFGDNLSSRI